MQNYLKFLDYLMGNIDKYFAEQAPYIKCEVGCSKCCSNGDYPFSEMEVRLLKVGFGRLDEDTKKIILNNIKRIIEAKSKHSSDERFTYACPFLINDVCSVYEFRGLICRTFGLIYSKEGEKMKIPFCAYEGLNYSNVLDKEKDMLVEEKMKELGIPIEPKAYNIHYDFLTCERVAHAFNFDYGKRGPLIDLLAEDKMFNP